MKAWPVGALLVAAAACGGESNRDLFGDPGSGGSSASGGKGSGGSTAGVGAGGAGGAGGTAAGGAGTGGKATGGTGGTMTTGGTGGGVTTGGSGGGAGAGAMGGSSMAGMGGGLAGAAGRSMTTGGAGGGGAPTCDGLANAYARMLDSARACNPAIDSEQCTEHLPASLPCGCVIHVNPGNEQAVAELKRLQDQHGKMGCVMACPEDIACIDREGVCSTSGTGSMGRCVESATTE